MIEHYITLAALLFAVGIYGVFTCKNIIRILMCLEIMFNAVTINFVAFSAYTADISGQVFTLFIIAVGAAEVAVGLAIFLALFRTHKTTNIRDIDSLRRW
ncbi:MAG: NADH-quinone oxidoreductase subunit K [Candidatus Altiarchaeales archaeon IMC4]|nr:MAG: NADH-quinone oxidoreductase subunit K [Candidatus Altiarchaeales archaeon IMC4]